MKKIIFLTSLIMLASCKIYNPFSKAKPQCYWMENYSGKYKWIPSEEVIGEKYNKSSCYAADSCNGGLGQSGGGCYKWSVGPDAKIIPWDN